MEERLKQREIIKKLLATTTLTTDKPAYLISAKWYLTFTDVISLNDGDPTDEEIPPINNEVLLNNGRLRNDIKENCDFTILTPEVWKQLLQFYGGGPEVTAKVVYDPMKKHNVAIIRKISIFIYYKDQKKKIITTQYEKISDIKKKAIEAYALNTTDYDLYEYWNNQIGELLDSTKLLVEYSICDEQPLLMHSRNEELVESQSKSSSGKVDKSITQQVKPLFPNQNITKRYTPGICGLDNMGNTCFFNSALQCLMHTEKLTEYFSDKNWVNEISKTNPLGTKGALSVAYYKLLQNVYSGQYSHIAPGEMRRTLIKFAPNFDGYQQQDAQELLLFVLDGIHEDLNRIKKKPAVEPVEGDGTNDEETANTAWERYKSRNDSIIVDLFHGQLRSHLKCPQCHSDTVVFDPYASISLPVPPRAGYTPHFLFVPKDPKEPVKKLSFLVKGLWTIAQTKKYIASVQGTTCDVVMARVNFDKGGSISFSSGLFRPSSSNVLVFCEVPSRSQLQCPVFLDVYEKGIFLNSKRTVSGPYLMDVPSIDASEEDVLKCAEVYFSFLWDPENPDSESLWSTYEKDRAKWAPFGNTNGRMAVKIDYSNWFDSSPPFMPIKNMPWITGRCVHVFINPEHMTREKGFKWSRFMRVVETIEDKTKPETMTTLESCLSNFAEETVLDEENKWYCPKCKQFVCASKKMDIWKTPEILVIQLKRFTQGSMGYYKSDINVDYPEILDISDFVVGPHNKDLKYRLYAVTEHHGGMGGGHYTAHAKVGSQWVFFNDSSTSNSTKNDAINQAAYVLFYQKIHE